MPGRISDASIKAVRDAARIADVVGKQVALRSAGSGRLKGLCPFHDEKTPSFTVWPDGNRYYCFGCGAHGDVIDFVARLDNLTFVEAVERLAGQSGVGLTYEGGGAAPAREAGKRARGLTAHRLAAEFYAEQLGTPEAQIGRSFLLERGFDQAAAEQFGVGYAPGRWDALTQHLRGRGFSVDELVEFGLAKVGTRGPIDRFHRRLLWPIREPAGDVVGFGARRLHDDDPINAKYLNSPETALFKKSHLLYGADLARPHIARSYQAVVVEGYTDVMACHLAGVKTAVATCGTAFGDEHVRLLRRLLLDQDEQRAEVIFTFDGDAAGRAAALKTLQFEQRFVAQTFVAVDPDGRDPCELRQARGDVAVRELVASRVPLVEFAIRSTLERYDLDTAEGRSAGLHAAVPLVARLKDWALRDEYARRLSGWLGLPTPEPVLAAVRELRGGSRPGEDGAAQQRPARRPQSARPADAAAMSAEREALKLALQSPALAGPTFDGLEPAHFTHTEHQAVFSAIRAAGGVCAASDRGSWLQAVSAQARDESVRALVTRLAVEPLHYAGEAEQRYAVAVLARVQELHVTRQVVEVKSRVQRTNPVKEPDSYARLMGELLALEQVKRQLREAALPV